MDKRTLLAIVLSMAVMVGFFVLQDILYPQHPPAPPPEQVTQEPQMPAPPPRDIAGPSPDIMPPGEPGEIVPLQTVIIETEAIRVELSNAGGNIVSYQLKGHLDGGVPVEMIFAGDADPQAFAVAFGTRDDVIAGRVRPLDSNFHVNRISYLVVEFSQNFNTPEGGQFSLAKRYEFQPDEYMFELTVFLTGGPSVNSFNFGGATYTLMFSPQIGPRFTRLDERYEYRRYLSFRGRLRTERVTERAPAVITNQPAWAAIVGKYFTLATLPYANNFELAFTANPESGIPAASRLFITRPASANARIEDKYHFYLGPKNQENLGLYERGDNGFRLRDTGLSEIANNSGFWAILSPLENGLKWLLMLFYSAIPNYGIAIILVTLVVKIVMFPLTKKSSESTLKMQALAPKIKEIQEKHKGNPQKLNAEMAEFYKREGYNPLSGCLPMLVQLPIFFAMFQLFNNHFDLRGAMFIPGWITDLSVPESVYDFPEGFTLPLLGWTAIRLLPVIYVVSQLLYGKVLQNPAQQGNMQMKIMLYAMPIVFFFILYEMPSGLLIYWIMSNILTLVQQLIINKYMIRKKAAEVPPVETKQVIAPPPGGGRKKKKK